MAKSAADNQGIDNRINVVNSPGTSRKLEDVEKDTPTEKSASVIEISSKENLQV